MLRPTFVLALAALLTLSAAATLIFDPSSPADRVILASFGDGSASVSVLFRGPRDSDLTVSSSSLYTVGTVSSQDAEGGFTNYTVPFSFDNGVGSTAYTISVGDDSVEGSFIVAGFVIKDSDGKIVSGDDGDGVTAGQSGSNTYDVQAVGVDGRSVDISGTSISGREMTGVYFKEIDMSATSIDSDSFTLAIATYRVGTGSFIVAFESDAIVYRGESFETVLNVKQETSPEPPCVAVGGDITARDGFYMVPMFNLLTPPKSSPVGTVTMIIGSTSVDWDTSRSSLSQPDQVAAFRATASGSATFTCDGDDAAIMGGEVNAEGGDDSSSPELAVDNVGALPTDSGIQLIAVIRVVNSDPDVFPLSEAVKIVNEFCSRTGAESCTLLSVRDGSALLEIGGIVEDGSEAQAQSDLEESFEEPDCPFQTNTDYECPELELTSVTLENNAVAATSVVSSGLATWSIVLIACVGAFALIVLVVLGLWAVYRRSADASESDYSSSGPLGVPDPSDLLYEQSIVRDIYGRGDFPEGGPSQAVAEQRAREADLREEFPRPPSSSSGVSRGAGTDDASSTYSV